MNTGWFGNTMWVNGGGSYDMNALHQQYAAGLYARQQEEERRQREEAQRVQVTQQASTRCTDSEQCASGFACVGGSCQQIDPTGATGSGGTSGCGAAPGGSGGSGGGGTGGSGCGGPAASSGSSSAGGTGGIQACSTSSGGSCSGGRGIGAGTGSGGGGGNSCGARCCTCGTDGCGCYEGECPPPPPNCSRFCTEAAGMGSNVMSCGPKQCGLCEYCDRSDAKCKRRTYDSDCRCDYTCPGCMKCGVGGGCLIKNCPPPGSKPPKEPSSGGNCEPKCGSMHTCIWVDGEMQCSQETVCQDLPPDCEPCDCNCNDECGDCEICNSAGKCVPDPACNCETGDGKEYIRWELRYRHATGQISSGSWAYGPVFSCRTSSYDDNEPLIRTYCTPADESPSLVSTSGVDTGYIPASDAGWCCLENAYTQYTLKSSSGGTMWSGKINGLQTSDGGGIQNNCKFGGYVTFSAVSSNCGSCL